MTLATREAWGSAVTPLVSGIGQLFERSDSSASLFLFFRPSSMPPPFAAEDETPTSQDRAPPGSPAGARRGPDSISPATGEPTQDMLVRKRQVVLFCGLVYVCIWSLIRCLPGDV